MEDRRFPLCWPDGWKRAIGRRRASYKVGEEQAREEMLESLQKLGAKDVIVSTNVKEQNRLGLPMGGKSPSDPGAAVYFKRDGRELVVACDKWDRIGDNYRAIGLAVDALRQLQRCGASELLDRAFIGYAALPAAGGSSASSWRLELGFPPTGTVSRADVEDAFRRLARVRHPDQPGGSHADFVRLTLARDAAFREVT